MPNTDAGKAIASRNATTHGLFARDVVLPSLGEDPDGYRQLEGAWTTQLVPHNLLEQHYVEKIAAASWRLRRLHRWQAQLLEDDTLTEADRLDRLNTVMRHETALHRQIDTAVRMLTRDVPQLYARRLREEVMEETRVSERECQDDAEEARFVELEIQNRQYRLRKATAEATQTLADAPLDTDLPAATTKPEICRNEPEFAPAPSNSENPPLTGEGARNEREGSDSGSPELGRGGLPSGSLSLLKERAGGEVSEADDTEICQNELAAPDLDTAEAPANPNLLLTGEGADSEMCQNERRRLSRNPKRIIEYLDPDAKYRLSPEPYRVTQAKNRRFRRS